MQHLCLNANLMQPVLYLNHASRAGSSHDIRASILYILCLAPCYFHGKIIVSYVEASSEAAARARMAHGLNHGAGDFNKLSWRVLYTLSAVKVARIVVGSELGCGMSDVGCGNPNPHLISKQFCYISDF